MGSRCGRSDPSPLTIFRPGCAGSTLRMLGKDNQGSWLRAPRKEGRPLVPPVFQRKHYKSIAVQDLGRTAPAQQVLSSPPSRIDGAVETKSQSDWRAAKARPRLGRWAPRTRKDGFASIIMRVAERFFFPKNGKAGYQTVVSLHAFKMPESAPIS